MNAFTIHLEKLQFFSHHGVYDLEKNQGGHFEVEVQLDIQVSGSGIIQLPDTVDYSSLYQLIANRMNQPTELLETLCDDMSMLLLNADERIGQVWVQIRKLQPPIPGMRGTVSVSCTKKR